MPAFDRRRAVEAARRTRDLGRSALSRLGAGRSIRRRLARQEAEILALKKELARARGQEVPATSSPVFFVVGYQKSGTTWLMRMLDSHPDVLCRGEGRFFDSGWRQPSLRKTDELRPPSSLYNAVLNANYLRLWVERSVWSRDGDTREHLDNLTRMAVDYFLTQQLLRSGKKLVGDKSPLLTPETISEIFAVYPEAKVVHIIRDGRDAAVSALHHTWNFGAGRNPEVTAKKEDYRRDPERVIGSGQSIFTEDLLRKVAAEWSARVGRAVQDGPKLLGENYAEVRYEALLERPGKEIKRLLEFLGADASDESVRRCVESASFEKLSKGRKRGEEDATSFFRKGVAGDWKNVFTGRDKAIFKEEAGQTLVRLGYEKDYRW